MQEHASQAPEKQTVVEKKQPLFPPSSLAQWVSAGTSTATAVIAVYAFFFSSASQALVQYLHSELATRNSRIATMEAREAQLLLSVNRRESELEALEHKASELQGELVGLADQRNKLQQQITKSEAERSQLMSQVNEATAHLGRAQFSVVKEKLVGKLSGTIVVTWPLNLSSELYSSTGLKPRKVELWNDHLRFIRQEVDKLPVDEQELGREVIEKFISQCDHISKVTINIPALRAVKMEFDYKSWASMSEEDRSRQSADYKRREREVSQKFDTLMERITDAQAQIKDCFKNTAQ